MEIPAVALPVARSVWNDSLKRGDNEAPCPTEPELIPSPVPMAEGAAAAGASLAAGFSFVSFVSFFSGAAYEDKQNENIRMNINIYLQIYNNKCDVTSQYMTKMFWLTNV